MQYPNESFGLPNGQCPASVNFVAQILSPPQQDLLPSPFKNDNAGVKIKTPQPDSKKKQFSAPILASANVRTSLT